LLKKHYNISELTCKIEISSIEQHNISFAPNGAPKSNYEKVLVTSKKFRKNCVYLPHSNLFTFHYSPYVTTRWYCA